MEEYSTARHVWDLSSTDLSEIAYNSLLIAAGHHGDARTKVPADATTNATNVPECRRIFRATALRGEHALVSDDTAASMAREKKQLLG